jgi:hypothetical protein
MAETAQEIIDSLSKDEDNEEFDEDDEEIEEIDDD